MVFPCTSQAGFLRASYLRITGILRVLAGCTVAAAAAAVG